MSRIEFPKVYNPANQTASELIENFVVRTKIFREIFEEIRNSEMKYPEQHYIIQGIRGQGKTTLLLRIAYEIDNDKALRRRLIPIVFNEEQYNISRLFKLWETIAEYLEESGEIKGLYEEMQEFENDDDYESRCFQLLESTLKNSNKKLIVFIDNIDEMLSKFSKKEHHRLREVFVESAEFRVIGASSVMLEFHYDYGKPFYQFFKMPQLKSLTTTETKTLLLKLGKHYKRDRVRDIVKNQPGRVEALRRITGGVIRTIVILFEIFVDDTNGTAFLDLEKILDAVTPLYKHRMDKLSAQKQEIVDFIALSWDAVSAREIAKKTKLKSKAVSAQLKQLVKDQIVEKEKTATKNYLYRISERFFNIWYLMCLGRKWDEKRVQFLVEFLQIWCDEEELENRAKKHLRTIKEDANAMNSLAWLYFQQKTHKNKALGFAEQAYKGENDVFNSHTYSMVLLWDNDIEKAYRVAQDFLTNAESFEEFPEDVSLFLMLLVAKKQYHLALKIFNENPHKLKDRFKPIYYALMYFMQDEYPNEYRKMGGELNQTVQEIIEKIHQLEEQYK